MFPMMHYLRRMFKTVVQEVTHKPRTCDNSKCLPGATQTYMADGRPKSKYVFLSPWPVKPGSGVNAVILGLAEAMRERYDPVVVVTGWSLPPPGQIQLKLPDFAPLLREAAAFAVWFLPNMLRLRRVARSAVAMNPHFVGLELLPLLALRKLGLCPMVILSVHGADVSQATRASGVKAALYRSLFAAADLVVACSRSLESAVRTVSPSSNVVAIWNGVTRPPDLSEVRPMDAPYLVCVAGFVEKKAHDILLPAFREILRQRGDLKLVLIGNDGPCRASVFSLIQHLQLSDKVTVMSDLQNHQVLWWVRHAECLVLPSREEPFGIALLEAAVLGTPVVATRVGGVPEFVTDGVHGLLCEPERPDQLAAAVFATLSDPEKTRMRARAFKDRALALTWDRVFAEYRAKANLP
jgi:glycosyltransferase involved in cell wall biosynthesis